MKKDKQEPVKAARKAIKKDIKQDLITKLKEVMVSMGKGSKKLEKEIEKASDKLAKKLSKELEADQLHSLGADREQKTAQEGINLKNNTKYDPASSNTLTAKKNKSGSKATKGVKQEA